MTCAYFSVSAQCSWRRPCSASTSASVSCHLLLPEDDRAVEVVAVARHRRQVEAGLEQALRELARAVRPEVEEDRRVAGLEPGTAGEMRGLDELVRDAGVVLRLHVGDRVVGRRRLARTTIAS